MSTASASAVIVADDRLGVQLRHARRADHHGRGAGRLRRAAVADAGPRAFRRRARDDANPAVDLLVDDLEHALPLPIVEPRHLTGHAEHGHAVDARADEQIDDPPKTVVVDVAGGRERRGQNRIHPFELHASSFSNAHGPHPMRSRSATPASLGPQALLNAHGAPPPCALARRLRASLGPQALLTPNGPVRSADRRPDCDCRPRLSTDDCRPPTVLIVDRPRFSREAWRRR